MDAAAFSTPHPFDRRDLSPRHLSDGTGSNAVRLVLVGGGLSAATLVVQLIRNTTVPLAVTIIEPREHLGRGLAYSATDPDHRLNAPLEAHGLDPAQPNELRDWFDKNGLLEGDPECLSKGGQVFMRRGQLGAYFTEQLRALASACPAGSTIRHVRDVAVAASRRDRGYTVDTAESGDFDADMLVIATGNPPPSLRPPFSPEHRDHPRIIGNPLEPGCIDRIPTEARVLVVGGGLTALDIVSTMVRRNHDGGIDVISRRGLRPRAHSPQILGLVPVEPGKSVLVNTNVPIPEFIKAAPLTLRGWTRAVRREIEKAAKAGRSWHEPMDQVRDAVWQMWPQLPIREKQRFLRRMRVFYDVHRFRTPPMNDQMVRKAEHEGRVRFRGASLAAVHSSSGEGKIRVDLEHAVTHARSIEEFDYVVNCTGLDAGSAWKSNPFLRAAVDAGAIQIHPTSMGFDVGPHCEARDASGELQPALRVIGPPTAGVFGDPLGIPFITGQVRRIVPDLVTTLESIATRSAHNVR